MELYQAPTPVPPSLDLFLAGGISNCPNWQALMLSSLSDLAISVANPRRDAYDYAMDEARQVEWEHHALNRSKCVSFWFPEETLCPITLFELGRFASQTQTPIFVGLHPRYGRHVNVTTQLRLARPEVQIANSVEELAAQVKAYFGSQGTPDPAWAKAGEASPPPAWLQSLNQPAKDESIDQTVNKLGLNTRAIASKAESLLQASLQDLAPLFREDEHALRKTGGSEKS